MMSDYEKCELYRLVETVRLIAESSVFVAEVILHLKKNSQMTLHDFAMLQLANKEMKRLNDETSAISELLVKLHGGSEQEEE
tara:strand:+ start:5580 stop:5825 length:246 start_codon:yes stop_codon:yes gene_type:complete